MGPPEMLNANDILRSKPAESAGPRCAGIPIFFRHQPEEIAWLISNVLSLSHQALPTLFLGTHHFPEELFTRQDVVLTHHRQSPLHLYYPYYLRTKRDRRETCARIRAGAADGQKSAAPVRQGIRVGAADSSEDNNLW
jgi:hypothetical protein